MNFRFASGLLIVSATFVAPPAMGAHSLEQLLAMVPSESHAILIVSDLSRCSKDMESCLARMDRPETLMVGRPIDQLQSFLEIPSGFNETGAICAWTHDASWTALIPVTGGGDSIAALIESGGAAPVEANDRVIHMQRGEATLFVRRELVTHHESDYLLISTDLERASAYSIPTEGAWNAFSSIAGECGLALATTADIVIAVGPNSKTSALPAPFAAFSQLGEGYRGALLALDVDPMGLLVRAVVNADSGSPLANVFSGGVRSMAALTRLPKATPYAAVSVDIVGLGGGERFVSLAKSVDPEGKILPQWILARPDLVRWAQASAYPSKLGILAGGILNDSALVAGCNDPSALLEVMRHNVMGMSGTSGTFRTTATWTPEFEVKDNGVACAFGVKEEPLGPSEIPTAPESPSTEQFGGDAMAQMAKRVIYGSRGMHGLAHAHTDSLVVTFSQRPDVFGRAKKAVLAEGEALADDAVVRALANMAALDADLVAVIGIGPLARVVKQVSSAFGAPAESGPLGQVSTKTEPLYFALELQDGRAEAALIIPSSVLALGLQYAVTAMPSTPSPEDSDDPVVEVAPVVP
ncbi:MAG: hypothetical protein O2800_06650 [Planctomycetota bacterium]|nr:hypothetical protein [Planctomycetota bacterium]